MIMTNSNLNKCSLCDEYYYGLGHNADPWDGRCCDECNEHMVVKARLLISMSDNPQGVIERLRGYKYA